MTGTTLKRQKNQAPEARDAAPPDIQTPTVIDVEARPITRERPTQTALLIDRGLALLSSLARLALLWVENREEQAQRITPAQRTSTTSTPKVRRSTSSRSSGRRQRRRHRGRTNT